MDLIIKPAKRADLNEIVNLLSDNNLPTIDISENTVQLFNGLFDNKIIGIIGLEKYNNVGLLRSLAVKDTFKNQKIGERLVKHLLNFSSAEKIEELYLLTTTAEKYFESDRIVLPTPSDKSAKDFFRLLASIGPKETRTDSAAAVAADWVAGARTAATAHGQSRSMRKRRVPTGTHRACQTSSRLSSSPLCAPSQTSKQLPALPCRGPLLRRLNHSY